MRETHTHGIAHEHRLAFRCHDTHDPYQMPDMMPNDVWRLWWMPCVLISDGCILWQVQALAVRGMHTGSGEAWRVWFST